MNEELTIIEGRNGWKEEDMAEEKTILIVDDEKTIVTILRFNLESRGYRILEAYDGESGLKKARTEKPDLILVHGDTSTSFIASLTGFYMGIPVGHVEAGLRTYNMKSPYPEEFNRQSRQNFCDWKYCH